MTAHDARMRFRQAVVGLDIAADAIAGLPDPEGPPDPARPVVVRDAVVQQIRAALASVWRLYGRYFPSELADRGQVVHSGPEAAEMSARMRGVTWPEEEMR